MSRRKNKAHANFEKPDVVKKHRHRGGRNRRAQHYSPAASQPLGKNIPTGPKSTSSTVTTAKKGVNFQPIGKRRHAEPVDEHTGPIPTGPKAKREISPSKGIAANQGANFELMGKRGEEEQVDGRDVMSLLWDYLEVEETKLQRELGEGISCSS